MVYDIDGVTILAITGGLSRGCRAGDRMTEQSQSEELFNKIHRLVKHGEIAEIRHLLNDGLNPNFANRFGWTLLMLSALEGNTSLGELLIAAGATVDATNKFGQTALWHAISKGHVGFAKLLLDHGAIPDATLEGWPPMTCLSPTQAEAVRSIIHDSLHKRSPR
jgi:ankyrin repeat protein